MHMKKLTTLLVNANGALVPNDSIDKHMIKKVNGKLNSIKHFKFP